MEEQQNQAVVLQQPKDSMLVVKVEQDTDLVAIGALVVSVLAFLVTIHIVRQSTKSQIESNKLLIEKQNELKLAELWTATTLLDKYRLFFLHRRKHYEWTTIYPRI